LPGPRDHLDMLAADLDDGFSCVWVVPDELVESGAAGQLVDAVIARVGGVRVEAPQRGRVVVPAVVRWEAVDVAELPEWARSPLGLVESDEAEEREPAGVERPAETVADKLCALFEVVPDGDLLGALVADERLVGRVVVLCGWDGWDAADLGACLTRFTALLKERGTPPARRPRLFVAVRENDLPARVLDGGDPAMTRVRWWWDVLGRLDTATVAATARRTVPRAAETLRDQVAAEVVIEVAGPDLLLAEHLAARWDGRLVTLGEQVEALPHEVAEDVLPARLDGRAGSDSPARALRPAWRGGVLDRWDGRVRISPSVKVAASGDGVLDTLVWRGQSRVLTPLVDACRARLEKVLRDRAPQSVVELLEQQQEEEDRRRNGARARYGRGVLELGAMAWAVAMRRVRLPSEDADLLFCARDVRNALAHLSPLTDEDVDRLAGVLPETLW
jgi:hypothetical protein